MFTNYNSMIKQDIVIGAQNQIESRVKINKYSTCPIAFTLGHIHKKNKANKVRPLQHNIELMPACANQSLATIVGIQIDSNNIHYQPVS